MNASLLKLPSVHTMSKHVARKTKISLFSLGLLWGCPSLSYAKLTQPLPPASHEIDATEVNILDVQRYTGSLLSPSGAVTQAGSLMLEPYFQSTISRGAYQADGAVRNSKHRTDSANSFLLIKYGLTDNLSIQVTPQVIYYWNGRTTSSSVHFSDLPVEFQYRWIDQDNARYIPSLTTYLGMNFPTGDYADLGRALDGAGTGSYALRFGLQSQAAYNIYNHALRVRLWGVARKPVSSTNIHNISSYGTGTGYDGNVKSGLFGNWGFSLEYGLTKEWVLAFDFQYDWGKGTRMRGAYPNQPFQRYVTGAYHDIQVAPAIEYNPTPAIGIIVGTSLTVNGHNTNDFVQPQFAVNFAF
ncbi:transporter [Commensalibacter oyaizuii]|uniref:Transporter n=1 Tax=Commensalibacter oyaizuii TaxID=3043873 RepID=A0ABT6Q0C0_9PROT|nr:transporter [Commensalibacter sp. TBRC 16381]MDI2090552.1 hypothetical protein [Commensalibacter sp. TBRC 16381]